MTFVTFFFFFSDILIQSSLILYLQRKIASVFNSSPISLNDRPLYFILDIKLVPSLIFQRLARDDRALYGILDIKLVYFILFHGYHGIIGLMIKPQCRYLYNSTTLNRFILAFLSPDVFNFKVVFSNSNLIFVSLQEGFLGEYLLQGLQCFR